MNKNAMISMICGIISLVLGLIAPVNLITTFSVIIIVIGGIAIVFSILAKRELKKLNDEGKGKGKSQATAGLVLGIISIALGIMNFMALYILNDEEISSIAYCTNVEMVSECVTNSDDVTSTCKYMNSLDVQCKNEVLVEEQYK